MGIASDIVYGKSFELPVARLVAEALWPGSIAVELPTFSDLDTGIVLSGKLVAFVEVKSRRTSFAKYPTTLVALRKHEAAKHAKADLKLPTACVVVFTDAVGVFDLCTPPDDVVEVTRHDRPGKAVTHAAYKIERMKVLESVFAAMMGGGSDEKQPSN